MFLEIVAATFAGVAVGTFTGLSPGIHINFVAVLLLGSAAFLLRFTSPIVLCVFVIAMGITHSFLDAIPSIFIGAPDSDMVMSVLPGHRLLMDGKGYEAVKLTVIGSLCCLLLGIAAIPAAIVVFPVVYNLLRDFVGIILAAAAAFLILREKGGNKQFWAAIVFLCSGIFGIVVLSFPNLNQPLFPMLSGLFGISSLATSLTQRVILPKQEATETIQLGRMDKIRAFGAATLSGAFVSLFPGLGPAQAAVLSTALFRNIRDYAYLVLIGGINTVNFLLALVSFYTMQKARNGAIAALSEIIASITGKELALLAVVALIAGGISTVLALKIARLFSGLIIRINYQLLSLAVIAVIIGLVGWFSGIIGMFVLLIATAIGIIPVCTGVGRSHSMGCLLLPVILFFML